MTKESGSLYCKHTRKIVKRFKKVNGMAVDSTVDSETWIKLMAKAMEQLPLRIN